MHGTQNNLEKNKLDGLILSISKLSTNYCNQGVVLA